MNCETVLVFFEECPMIKSGSNPLGGVLSWNEHMKN